MNRMNRMNETDKDFQKMINVFKGVVDLHKLIRPEDTTNDSKLYDVTEFQTKTSADAFVKGLILGMALLADDFNTLSPESALLIATQVTKAHEHAKSFDNLDEQVSTTSNLIN